MKRVPDDFLRYLPETVAERREFDAFCEDASVRRRSWTPGLGRDLIGDGRPGIGDFIRTTVAWSAEQGLPVLHGQLVEMAAEINGGPLLGRVVPPAGPSLLPAAGLFLPMAALELDGPEGVS